MQVGLADPAVRVAQEVPLPSPLTLMGRQEAHPNTGIEGYLGQYLCLLAAAAVSQQLGAHRGSWTVSVSAPPARV